eukprot:TRINITY_DN24852_c0_g1_i1.p2 TRINITY_DN24852_c0_g1~~TRINITY_DN24852_c0_g1_i1.p2  ORF type:complete len:136 (+),score=14.65 TRINITY_DN24852_c0_g1_i1:106-513(+)
MVAFLASQLRSFVMPERIEMPEKNTFIHFDDEEPEACRRADRRQATCPEVVQRRAFRTKTFLQRREEQKQAEHLRGDCRPCAYYAFKEDGCRQGEDCDYCHLCTKASIRRQKRARAKASQKPVSQSRLPPPPGCF